MNRRRKARKGRRRGGGGGIYITEAKLPLGRSPHSEDSPAFGDGQCVRPATGDGAVGLWQYKHIRSMRGCSAVASDDKSITQQ